MVRRKRMRPGSCMHGHAAGYRLSPQLRHSARTPPRLRAVPAGVLTIRHLLEVVLALIVAPCRDRVKQRVVMVCAHAKRC